MVGAVTQPWKADVVFRARPPDECVTYEEPGYVKIAWTLRADPLGDAQSAFRTETRAVSTDPLARARSSHNTQPWPFKVSDGRVELHADRTRALPVNDPYDRGLTISCDAALFNFEVVAAAPGYQHATRQDP